MPGDLKTVYRAANLPEAKLVADELELRGIRAIVTGETLANTAIGFTHQASPWVMVAEEDLEKAERAIEGFRQMLDTRGISIREDPPSDQDEYWKDWPKCEGCGRLRIARCPACEQTGTRTAFPLADYHEPGEAVRSLNDEGEVTIVEEESDLPFLLCPHCDETFRATFYRRCANCGHDSGSGIEPRPTREPPNEPVLAYVGAALLLLVSLILVYWALSLRK